VHKAGEAVDDDGKETPEAVDTNAPVARRARNPPVEKDSAHVDAGLETFLGMAGRPVKDAAARPTPGGKWR